MITMAMKGKIRAMHLREGKSISEIARRTSLARNTIKKWLRAPRGTEPGYRRRDKPGKLSAFEAQLIQALEADQGQCLGYVRAIGNRRAGVRIDEPIVSYPAQYEQKPLLRATE